MPVLHYDFETSGLPLPGQPANDPRHPHALSLSAILDDDGGVTRRVMSCLIKPTAGFKIDERLVGDDKKPTAFSVNGITNEHVETYGVTMSNALADFVEMTPAGTILSAYNHHFDFKQIKIGCARIPGGDDMRDYLESGVLQQLCTMESAALHLIGKKRMSLKSAYFELFKRENANAHQSLGDAMASREIYWELKKRGGLMAPMTITAKQYDTPAPAVPATA